MTWHWIIVLVCAAAAFALWHSPRMASVVNNVSNSSKSLLTIVCTTPNKPESVSRASHMRRLCERENLNPFALTTELGLFVDKKSEESVRLGREFPPNTRPEVPAHYASYLRALRLFLRSEFSYLLLLEDDIVRTESDVSVHRAIADAPPFGLLFLEYCYADCSKPSAGGYARGYGAMCTGACVFTREGARDFLAFADTHRKVIDIVTMDYSRTREHESSVIYADPPLFRQDRVMFPDGVSSDQGPVLPRCMSA